MEFNPNQLWSVSLFLFIAAALYLSYTTYVRSSKYRFPPGPKGLPLVGNLFQLPGSLGQGRVAKKWADKYGEMVHIRLAQTDLVYLNSSRVVHEILERRSAITSDRQILPMTNDIVSDSNRIVVMRYNQKWRNVRRVIHQNLMTKKVEAFQPVIERESCQLLWEYYEQPERWFEHNNRFANSLILSVLFGVRKAAPDKELDEVLGASADFIENLQIGRNLVDVFPSLASLPKWLQWWRPRGERVYERARKAYEPIQQLMFQKIADGSAANCFGRTVNEERNALGFSQNEAMFIVSSLLEAGSDTTRGTLNGMFAGALAYPDWAERARQHLDRVCGDAERLPGFGDTKELPYIKAVVKETLRWRPFVDAGMNHMCTEDFEFEGYYFPEGTAFTWNAWAISQNPEEYEDPARFWPERYLNEHIDNPLYGVWGFGVGRRVCAGYPLAARSLFISISRLLYCFDFEYGGEGKFVYDDDTEFFFPATSAPFPIKFKPRSAKHADLIKRTWREAEPLLRTS